MNKLVRKNKKGFTLTEMIVVIAIIGILAAVMIPSVVFYVKKARQNAAYQQAVAAYDVYEVYLTEKDAGMIDVNESHRCKGGTNHNYDDGICTNTYTDSEKNEKTCNAVKDNKYADFKEYYLETVGKAFNGDGFDNNGTENVEDDTFIFTADNDIVVTLDINDLSATYE